MKQYYLEEMLANTSFNEEQINEMENWEIEMHLGLSLDQQEALLAIHQQILEQRFELIRQIKKEYII